MLLKFVSKSTKGLFHVNNYLLNNCPTETAAEQWAPHLYIHINFWIHVIKQFQIHRACVAMCSQLPIAVGLRATPGRSLTTLNYVLAPFESLLSDIRFFVVNMSQLFILWLSKSQGKCEPTAKTGSWAQLCIYNAAKRWAGLMLGYKNDLCQFGSIQVKMKDSFLFKYGLWFLDIHKFHAKYEKPTWWVEIQPSVTLQKPL